jgi:hypothetical protein
MNTILSQSANAPSNQVATKPGENPVVVNDLAEFDLWRDDVGAAPGDQVDLAAGAPGAP